MQSYSRTQLLRVNHRRSSPIFFCGEWAAVHRLDPNPDLEEPHLTKNVLDALFTLLGHLSLFTVRVHSHLRMSTFPPSRVAIPFARHQQRVPHLPLVVVVVVAVVGDVDRHEGSGCGRTR